MSKILRTLTAFLAAITLSSIGMSPAKAESTANLTFEQFMASDAYQDYVDANLANMAYLKAQNGITMDLALTMQYDQAPAVTTLTKIESNKQNSRVTMSTGELTMNIVIIGDTAYTDLNTYNTYFGPENRTKVFGRIGTPTGKSIKMKAIPSEVDDFTPAKILDNPAGVQTELMQSQYAGFAELLKFTEMVKTPNPDDPTKTDYSFGFELDLLGTKIRADQISTFDSNSLLVKSVGSSSAVSVALTISSDVVLTTSVTPDLAIVAPTQVLDENTIIKTSNQITAEGKSTAKAAAITKKAAELAKKAKKPVSAAYLVSAAKALKYTVTKLSNGVKLSSTVSGVKGSLCVTVSKGKTSTKNC
ncbi:MAG: hypothetical protein EBZ61_01545 [Micrococcales bacterium]|nr:hypothetical protein [Micrococcales bacterium]